MRESELRKAGVVGRSDKMGRIAVIIGGTGMAACQLAPHLADDFTGKDAFDKVAVLALGVNEETFKGKSKRAITPLKGANLNDAKTIAASLREAGCEQVTHVYWFLDANRPPKLGHTVELRQAMTVVTDNLRGVVKPIINATPETLKSKMYGQLAYLAGSGEQPKNIEWLNNVMSALDEVKAPLANFTMCHGGKHYGMHLGPALFPDYATPFEEDKHKCHGPLSYFEMQEWLEAKAAEKKFAWNIVRPTFIIGNAIEKTNTTQSFGLVLSIYANVLKAQGRPLVFPGPVGAWNARIQLSTSTKIAHVAAWASTNSVAGLHKFAMLPDAAESYSDPAYRATANQAFNVVSCPEFSWGEIWEQIARYFGMQSGGAPTTMGGMLAMDVMGGEQAAAREWRQMQRNHDLQKLTFNEVFNADFLDKSFTSTWDSQFSTDKISKARFPEDQVLESDALSIMTDFFDSLKRDKLIPAEDKRKSR